MRIGSFQTAFLLEKQTGVSVVSNTGKHPLYGFQTALSQYPFMQNQVRARGG
ncbi:hypothetical protein NEIELOOT_01920 [Neisseria elongata subsp. glycolytica ATCC 29315]|uniref:Uncharacterized protein n=1 Tax=Neisseria elongata subsp. glycolytica ATCC 29315 TaxID=546263 RepID=D4DS77_NEIEG|nr:hypothetical protein NEIELOOT_01920 [Neisseria elongata subsp. glycolytica ATCC 29315]